MIDLSKEIRRAVETGKVVFGSRKVQKLLLKEKPELVIVANNCPKALKERTKEYCLIAGIPLQNFEGNGLQLGAVCGKPFNVSMLAVQKSGKSNILGLKKK